MSSPKDLLFGRMAISRGLLTKEQLDECVEFQKERAPNCPLGLVMIDKGFVTSDQLQELVTAQKQAFEGLDPIRLRKIEDAVFGQIAVKEGMATADEVHQSLRDQALADEAGHPRRLGELLVERGVLAPEQVGMILEIQRRRIVICPSCGAQFNVEKLAAGKKFICGKCRTTLEVPSGEPPPPPPLLVRKPAPAAPPPVPEPESGGGIGDLEAFEGEFAGAGAAAAAETGAGDAGEDSAGDIESMRTMAIPAIGRAVRTGDEADDDSGAPAEDGEGEDLESRQTMAMPSIGAGSRGDVEDVENLRTMAAPGLGRVSEAGDDAEDVENLRTMEAPGLGRSSSVEDVPSGLEAMQTMAVEGVGRASDQEDEAPTGLESMATMALPAVGATRPKAVDPNAPITVACSCGKKITAPAKMAGRTGKCPGCGASVTIPKPAPPDDSFTLERAEPTSEEGRTPNTKTREKPVRRVKAGVMPASDPGASDGMRFAVTWLAGSMGSAHDGRMRGEGTLRVKNESLVFEGGQEAKRITLLTFLGAPLCLAGGGAALALQWLPQIPALAAGAGAALAVAVLDRLLHRGGGGETETLEIGRSAVKQYKSEPKPKISIAVTVPGRGELCFTLIPKPADRKRMLQILSEMF